MCVHICIVFVLCAYKYFITFHLSSHSNVVALETNYCDSDRHLCLSYNLYFLCLHVNKGEWYVINVKVTVSQTARKYYYCWNIDLKTNFQYIIWPIPTSATTINKKHAINIISADNATHGMYWKWSRREQTEAPGGTVPGVRPSALQAERWERRSSVERVQEGDRVSGCCHYPRKVVCRGWRATVSCYTYEGEKKDA